MFVSTLPRNDEGLPRPTFIPPMNSSMTMNTSDDHGISSCRNYDLGAEKSSISTPSREPYDAPNGENVLAIDVRDTNNSKAGALIIEGKYRTGGGRGGSGLRRVVET
jgi:hypothetical protein